MKRKRKNHKWGHHAKARRLQQKHTPTLKTLKQKALMYIEQCSYEKLLRLLLKKSKSCRRSFSQIVEKKIKIETRSYCKSKNLLKLEMNQTNLQSFSWSAMLKECQQNLPTLYASICGAVYKKGKNVPQAAIGGLLSTMLYLRNKNLKFVQSMNGVKLWKGGCSQSVMQAFQTMGVSLGPKGVRAAVDQVNCDLAEQPQTSKKADEESIGTKEQNVESEAQSTEVKNFDDSLEDAEESDEMSEESSEDSDNDVEFEIEIEDDCETE